MYRYGEGVTLDRDKAIFWYKKASEQGDLRAKDKLGMFLFMIIFIDVLYSFFSFF